MTRLLLVFLIISFSAATVSAQMAVKMERVVGAYRGDTVPVDIHLENPPPALQLGGLNFLFHHHEALTLVDVQPGFILNECGWEYLTYNTTFTGATQIIALADIANGANYPDCYAAFSGVLLTLSMAISNDPAIEGLQLPITWWWYECGDNTLSSMTGGTLYYSDRVFDAYGYDITLDTTFPNLRGAPESCLSGDTSTARRAVDFYNGGVAIQRVDNEPPVAVCPDDIQVLTEPGQCGAIVEYESQVFDNWPGATIFCYPPSGSFFNEGVTVVDCSAMDASGNVDSCHFLVRVTDDEYPIITCPEDISIGTDPGECSAVLAYQPTAEDNCPDVSITCYPPSGSAFDVGTTEVLAIATDGSGLYDGCYFDVTVEDTEPPEIVCPDDLSLQTDPGQCGTNVTYTPTATDNCSDVDLVMTPPSGTLFEPGINSVTVVATDSSGNSDSCSFTIEVTDTEAPHIDCPDNISVVNDSGSYGAVVTFETGVTDNCPDPQLSAAPPSGSFFDTGVTEVVIAAEDAHGNVDTCRFTVEVLLNDPDSDGIPSWDDNCPETFNPEQRDADEDQTGDVCDECTDTDGDGFGDPGYAANICQTDNCPAVDNPDQADADLDGAGDLCDECTDTDGDGFGDPGYPDNTCQIDNCPEDHNPSQSDADADGIGDACCCVGMRGNVDCSPGDGVDITDVQVMVDHLFGTLAPLCCPDEGDTDGSTVVDITDLQYLINNQFLTLTPLPACP